MSLHASPPPGPALTPIDTALATLLASLPEPTATEAVLLANACGRVLRQAIVAEMSVPPHANSAMDGYAVRAADTRDPMRKLPVSQRLAAGQVGKPLAIGTAARLFTGAPMPEGADAVVMQENCVRHGDTVCVNNAVEPGENVRPAGADIESGSTVFDAGRVLRPQDIGAVASLGLTQVDVARPLRVALMTTGDELKRPGSTLEPGQIFDANFASLGALLESLGATVIDCGRVGDTAEKTRAALKAAAADADCVISTGGVSVGEEDHVRAAVEALGNIALWKLAVKPGKPFAFGRIGKDEGEACPFFGLPGNPVSAFVTFALIVRPCLFALQGATPQSPLTFPVRSGFARPRSGVRQEYLRATLKRDEEGGLAALPLGNQSSGVAASLSRSEGLLVIPPDTAVALDDLLQFIPYSELGA
jgi:molybdopterin molybdotransferase